MKTTVRWRLTLLYGSLFLVGGAALLAVTYALVAHDVTGPVQVGKVPSGTRFVRIDPGDAPPSNVNRVLGSPAGQAAVRYVGAKQRIADLHQLEIESAIALAIMVVISGGLGWLVAGRVLRPLEESLAAQRRFVANASHELRTPLTTVRALLEMVIGDPRASVSSFRQACREALEESEQQEQLIDALLALAEGQRGLERHEVVDLADVVAEVRRAHQAESDAAGLELDVALAPAVVRGDRRLLVRLVSNLFQNAIRHNVAHGRVDVHVGSRGGRAVLTIANTGPVIEAGEVGRLLAPFERIAPDRASPRDGFGLGLSIVAAVAAAHDAELDVRPGEQGGLLVEARFTAADARAGAVGVANPLDDAAGLCHAREA
jgi:signal transduction histidine kinase